MRKEMILDIACSHNKAKGAIGLDRDKDSDADIICNLEKTLPLKSDFFDKIYCKHILEHLDNPQRLIEEIYRVSKSKAHVIIEVPHFSSYVAYSNLGHKRYFSFFLLDRLMDSLPHKTIKKEITFYKTFRFFGIKALVNHNKENYERFWTYIFPAENIKFELEVEK